MKEASIYTQSLERASRWLTWQEANFDVGVIVTCKAQPFWYLWKVIYA